MKGQITKVSSNKYIVSANGEKFTCNARGLFKLKGQDLSVGDYVEFDKGVITSVFDRQNKFIRPNVANVDLILIVISPLPKPDFILLDKLLINAEKEGVNVAIVINKTDISDTLFAQINNEYGDIVEKIFSVSAKNLDGIQEIKDYLSGKLTVLAGQSAVGKTSLINAMFNLQLKTGVLSDKTDRGKHTTTRSEIFEYDGVKLIDSPGFAVIDAEVSAEILPECYKEYFALSSQCKFRGCAHVDEPECKVKEKVSIGELSKERYERYVKIYKEITARRIDYEKD